MYSRSASRESNANNTSEPMRPTSRVSAKIAHIFHHARVLAFRLSMVARSASLFAVRLSAAPIALARTRTPSTPQNSQANCGSFPCTSQPIAAAGPADELGLTIVLSCAAHSPPRRLDPETPASPRPLQDASALQTSAN